MSERSGSNIQILGVKQTVAALKAFAPDLYDRMNADIKAALDRTREGAKGEFPDGSWSIRITKKNLLGTITTGRGVRNDKHWSQSSPGVKAAMWEFLGSTGMANTPDRRKAQVKGLIETLNARYGDVAGGGRLLWDAWDRTGDRVLMDIRQSVFDAEKKLQRRLDAAGEAF